MFPFCDTVNVNKQTATGGGTSDSDSQGLVHELKPFGDNFRYISGLRRCANDDCTASTSSPRTILANDTTFCPDEDRNPSNLPYDPNVNNVEEAIGVLDNTVGSTDRHWAYAAFYEPEGWTEENAPKIKGVRRPFPLPCSVFSLNLGPTGPIGLSLLASR